MTLATISYSLRPPSKKFPVGYGKVESLGALAVSGILLSGGFMIGMQALVALTQQFFPDIASFLSSIGVFGHIHSHGHSHHIVIKEWLYRSTLKIAEEKRSSV